MHGPEMCLVKVDHDEVSFVSFLDDPARHSA